MAAVGPSGDIEYGDAEPATTGVLQIREYRR
jgi:hypothetical protein